MKKCIFGRIAVLAIVSTAMFNVNLNSLNKNLSAVSLANVEALADENSNGQRYVCYNNITGFQGAIMEDKTYCTTCTSKPCSKWSNTDECTK
jgi:hypothetical protein